MKDNKIDYIILIVFSIIIVLFLGVYIKTYIEYYDTPIKDLPTGAYYILHGSGK
jgi:hypothetical protein